MTILFTKVTETEKIGAYGVNMHIPVTIGESIRFENTFDIMEELTVEYKNEDLRVYKKFFSVDYIKFLAIEKDYIHYEIHCI